MSIFRANLRRLIGVDEKPRQVNGWAESHHLEQTAIQRLVNGQDPRLSTIERIAAALGVPTWMLLVPDFDPDMQPSLRYGPPEALDQLAATVAALTREVQHLRLQLSEQQNEFEERARHADFGGGNSGLMDLDEGGKTKGGKG